MGSGFSDDVGASLLLLRDEDNGFICTRLLIGGDRTPALIILLFIVLALLFSLPLDALLITITSLRSDGKGDV
jgi:hypothetical protein